MSVQSETLREVGPEIDFGGTYCDIIEIGSNGHGRLYTASKAGKKFLLKAAEGESGRSVELLKREYEVMVPLSHPSIVSVFTYESYSPVGPCLVMEYVDGRTLEDYLRENPSQMQRRRVFTQLLDAVEYLHKKAVVHNDLSPRNILISNTDDAVKLIDFGFADDDSHFLGKGLGCTRSHASPELLAGERTDARSDIYSLGELMRDIFGKRFSFISSRAQESLPSRRYPSVSSLRRAWLKAIRVPKTLIELALLAILVLFAADFIRMKVEISRVNAERAEWTRRLDYYKTLVDTWYSSELPAAQAKMENLSYDESMEIWTRLVDDYNAFWRKIVRECPENCSAELTSYIALKYNSSFPLPPSE